VPPLAFSIRRSCSRPALKEVSSSILDTTMLIRTVATQNTARRSRNQSRAVFEEPVFSGDPDALAVFAKKAKSSALVSRRHDKCSRAFRAFVAALYDRFLADVVCLRWIERVADGADSNAGRHRRDATSPTATNATPPPTPPSPPANGTVTAIINGTSWSAGAAATYNEGRGSVTLTRLTADRAVGTFSFTLLPVPPASGTRQITNGVFDVPVRTPPPTPTGVIRGTMTATFALTNEGDDRPSHNC
jgi:hypothetical protein